MEINNRVKSYLEAGEHESQLLAFTSLYNTMQLVIDGGRSYTDSQSQTLSETLSLMLPAFKSTLTQLESIGKGDSSKDLALIIRTREASSALADEMLGILENGVFQQKDSPAEYQSFRSACYSVSSQICDASHEYHAILHKYIDPDYNVLTITAA